MKITSLGIQPVILLIILSGVLCSCSPERTISPPTSSPTSVPSPRPTLPPSATITPDDSLTSASLAEATQDAMATQIAINFATNQAKPTLSPPPASTTQTYSLLSLFGIEHLELESFRDDWKMYRNDDLGFSFQYPRLYDEIDLCRLKEFPRDNEAFDIQVGARIAITVWIDLETSLDEFIATQTGDFYEIEITNIVRDGVEGRSISYRYGTLGRSAYGVLYKQGDQFIALEITVPTACDFREIEITEFTAFNQILETFSFLE